MKRFCLNSQLTGLRVFLSKRPALISALLTLAFVAWLWHAGTGSQWLAQLEQVTPQVWGLMVLGMLISYGLRAWRISREFSDVTGMSWPLALRIVLAHTAMVNVMPMRSGELGFPWLMKRALQVDWLDASASLLWLRLQDASVLALLAIWVWPDLPMAWRMGWMAALLFSLWLGIQWVHRHGDTDATQARTTHGPRLADHHHHLVAETQLASVVVGRTASTNMVGWMGRRHGRRVIGTFACPRIGRRGQL